MVEFINFLLLDIKTNGDPEKNVFCNFFRGRELGRITEVVNSEDKLKFWKSPDLTLRSVRARFTWHPSYNTYLLYLNTPSSKAQEEQYAWPGSVIVFNPFRMKQLVDYLDEEVAKIAANKNGK